MNLRYPDISTEVTLEKPVVEERPIVVDKACLTEKPVALLPISARQARFTNRVGFYSSE